MKKILFLFFLSTVIFTLSSQASETYSLKKEIKSFYVKPKYDIRLDIDSRAKGWYEIADVDEIASNNIGALYFKNIKDYKKAEYWFKRSLSMKKNEKALFNLGLLYETIKKIDKAIFFYKKADSMNNKAATYNIAYLYEDLKDYKKAEYWYKEAIKKKHLSALKNLGILNHEIFKNDIKAVKYMIALADKKYPKEKILRFFKIKWKLDEKTIKKGYEEQIKAKDIPKSLKYTKGL